MKTRALPILASFVLGFATSFALHNELPSSVSQNGGGHGYCLKIIVQDGKHLTISFQRGDAFSFRLYV